MCLCSYLAVRRQEAKLAQIPDQVCCLGTDTGPLCCSHLHLPTALWLPSHAPEAIPDMQNKSPLAI